MYGNTSFEDDSSDVELTPDQRKALRRDLSTVASRTRELLPSEYIVGSELMESAAGPRATVAVQPPVGGIVSADYQLDGELTIDECEREDLAVGLAASAALQVKQAYRDGGSQTAR